MAHIYDIGTRAWQPDTTEGWVASEVTDKQIEGDKVKLVFQLESGEVRMSAWGKATPAVLIVSRPRRSRRPSTPSKLATTRICRR